MTNENKSSENIAREAAEKIRGYVVLFSDYEDIEDVKLVIQEAISSAVEARDKRIAELEAHADHYSKKYVDAVADRTEAVEAARAEEQENACKDMCLHCQHGFPAIFLGEELGWFHKINTDKAPCYAHNIRARGKEKACPACEQKVCPNPNHPGYAR